MKHFKRNMLVGVVLAAAAGGGWWWWRSRLEETKENEYFTHRVGSIAQTMRTEVQARGILQCADTWPALAGIRGRITDMVAQGTHVKAGDVLFSIDDTNAREEIENNETSMANAELSLVRLEAQYQLTDFQQTQNVLLSDARLKHAELEERLELEEPDARDRRLMDIAEKLAKLDVEDAEDEYERESRMLSKGYIAESALESYEQRLANARASYTELILQNTLTKKGATDERRVELRMNVQRAEHRKSRAEARKKRVIADIEANREAEEKERVRIQYILDYNGEEIKKATVKAPMDGVFMVETYRDWSTGGALKEVAVGDEKYPLDMVGQVINPARMEVRLVVHESDFHRLKPGLPVEVRMPAVPGRSYAGRLKRLGAIGRDRNHVDPTGILGGDSEISMFNAVIELESDGAVFHPGMSALVSIIIEDGAGKLLIPRSAVEAISEENYTVRMADGETRSLKGHYFNEMYFCVDSGLTEGEEIAISIYRGAVND